MNWHYIYSLLIGTYSFFIELFAAELVRDDILFFMTVQYSNVSIHVGIPLRKVSVFLNKISIQWRCGICKDTLFPLHKI